MLTHSSESFDCDQCSRKFHSLVFLNVHKGMHDLLVYICDQCGVVFSTNTYSDMFFKGSYSNEPLCMT